MTNQDPDLLRRKYPDKEGLSISTKSAPSAWSGRLMNSCCLNKTQNCCIMWTDWETLCSAWTSNIQQTQIRFTRCKSKQRSIKGSAGNGRCT
ncbi:hypothetical protein PO124_20640 [Bacillus licheniformis]|nr:hypothetical protein [Bacillus licheniformis]